MKLPVKNNAHRQESGSWRTNMIQQPLSNKKPNKETSNKTATRATKILGFLSLAIATLSFIGCGGEVENRPVAQTYTSDSIDQVEPDVAAFRNTLWSNILKAKGCDGCHKRGGSAENIGAFADDSVAHSYNRLNFANDDGEADENSFVDVDINPTTSRMVTKVAGPPGHHCWTANCANDAQEIVNMLGAWALLRGSIDVPNNPIPVGPVETTLTAPPLNEPQGAKAFPTDPNALLNGISFANTVYPILETNCSRCHTNTANVPQTPYFAHSDVTTAYNELVDAQKVDVNITTKSRIYERLIDNHNCWSGSCTNDAATMLTAINTWSNSLGAPQPIATNLVTSKALKLTEGQVSSGGPRFEQYLVAKYEFKAGSGNVIEDVSLNQPTVDLQLFGNYEWLGGWGIEFKPASGGLSHGYAKSQRIDDTKKLHDLIVPNSEYSIEAWVIPANVSQGDADPAMIVSYGAGANNRNLGLGQKEYQYASFTRVNTADGAPSMLTDGEALQAAQQHIVLTYHPVDPTDPNIGGHKFYVNGDLVLVDPNVLGDEVIGDLNQWDLSYLLSLGGDTDNTNPWLGSIRLLAIHNRALGQAEVTQNFDAGVGQKFNLLFSLSEIDPANILADSYMWFEVSEYDNFSYLFSSARFINLNGTVPSFTMKAMRLGINGKEPAVGQAYARLGTDVPTGLNINSANMSISSIGTVISKDLGVTIDQFFLTFEEISGQTDVRVPGTIPDLPYEYDLNNTKPYVVGLRTFEEIHTTMSQLTGVPKSVVDTTYNGVGGVGGVKEALPVSEDTSAFLSSHQMAIANLALAYCTQLVETTSYREAFFDAEGFFGVAPPNTETNANALDGIITTLYNKFATQNLDGIQPPLTEVKIELTNTRAANNAQDVVDINAPPANPLGLYERLYNSPSFDCANPNNTCDATHTRNLVTTMCMATLGSALTTVQ